MNFYAPNSAVANGTSGQIWLQGAASVAASASLSASANFVRSGSASLSGAVTLSASCTYIHKPDSTAPSVSGLFGVATKIHALAAAIGGSVNIQSFVLRDAFASANIDAEVSIVAIVADEIGASSVSATASVTATGTRIQPQGQSAPAGTMTVPAVASLATRKTTVLLDVSAEIYANPNVNGVSIEFATVTGTTTIALSNTLVLNTKTQVAGSLPILAQASSVPAGTVTQHAAALPTSVAAVVVAEPLIESTSVVQTLSGVAQVSATQTLTTLATATALASSAVQPVSARTRFNVQPITVQCSAVMVADLNNFFRPEVHYDGVASVVSAGVVNKLPTSTTAASVNVVIDGDQVVRSLVATADISGSSSVSVVGTAVKIATSTVTPSAAVASAGFITKLASGVVTGASNVIPIGLRTVTSSAELESTASCVEEGSSRLVFGTGVVSGQLIIFADSVSNPASLDPPERTFIKPAVQSDFVKLETEFVFRRAA